LGKLKSTEHGFKGLVFRIVAPFLKKGNPDNQRIDPLKVSKVLFLRPEKIGDMVISLPVFDAIKRGFPHIKISILASPRNYSLIKDDSRFENIYLYRKNIISDPKEVSRIRREKYDIIFDMIDDDSVTTLFLSQLCAVNAPRIGIGKRIHARYYDFNSDHSDGIGNHIIDNTMELLAPFGIDPHNCDKYSPPSLTLSALNKAEEFFADMNNAHYDKITIGFNLSAGMPNRIWQQEKLIELSKQISRNAKEINLLLITMPEDRSKGEEIISCCDNGVFLAPPALSLIDVSAFISKLDLLISPDTSLIHIARSFKVPVVGLYSDARKNFTRWQPYGQLDGAVIAKDNDNIFDVSVDQVFNQLMIVLRRLQKVPH